MSSKSIIAEVEIHHFGKPGTRLAPKEMADMAGLAFPLRERVPEAGGEAFDWAAWYAAWRVREGLENLPGPTHLKVTAADSFEATIPWEQLKDAAVLFQMDGEPLQKGAPVRLYVPNGTSACLNVKSVVSFRILHEDELSTDAEYGFKNVFSPEDLLPQR